MSEESKVGKLKESLIESFKVEWEITDFFLKDASSEDQNFFICSPDFSYAGKTWTLRLWPKAFYDRNYVHLQLGNARGYNGRPMQLLKCEFGLKRCNDILRIRNKFVDQFFDLSYAVNMSRTELFRRRESLTPENTLTVVCTLQCKDSPPSSHRPDTVKLKELETLSADFENLFTLKDSCDVTLQVKEKSYRAHKAVLIARSPVFASMFRHDSSESRTGVVTIPYCDPDSFNIFLEYLYSGKIDEISFQNVYNLYIIADKYEVLKLKSFSMEYLRKCLTEDNVCDVMMLADMYNDEHLLSDAQCFFNENASKVVLTEEWTKLLKDNYRLANKLIIEIISKSNVKHCRCSS